VKTDICRKYQHINNNPIQQKFHMKSYTTALISFIDILGFREIVASKECNDISKALESMRQFSQTERNSIDEENDPTDAKVIQFSDSIIRIRPLDTITTEESRYGVLFNELMDIGMMQGDLANHNIYIRGGITVGQIFQDEQNIFGPGFVRAYDLESKIANYPRIVIDRLIFDAMKDDERLFSSNNTPQYETDIIKRQMHRGSDGIHYIDYLSITEKNMTEPDKNLVNFIKKHKNNILHNIKSNKILNGETGKYLWTAIYHNEYLKRSGINNDDLRITEEELPLLETCSVNHYPKYQR